MSYVDLQRRRRPARDEGRSTGFLYDAKHNPYFSLAAGFGVGIPASWASLLLGFNYVDYGDPLSLLLSLLCVSPLTLLTLRGLLQFRRWGKSGGSLKLGSEKQLLMAILDAGGGITPVEAALETSLTVDEAEEILSSLADRGHLHVESRDGALAYTLPGKRQSDRLLAEPEMT